MTLCHVGKGFRIVLTQELREKYGIKEGDALILEDNGNGFTLSLADVSKRQAS